MLRIAQCTDTFLPIVDGVGRVVVNYADGLGKRGNEVYVICPRDDHGYLGGYHFEVVDYSGLAIPVSKRYRFGMPALDSHYNNRLGSIELDIIHAHSPGPSGLEAIRIAKKKKAPLIGTFHSKYYDDFYRVTSSENLAAMGAWYVSEFYNQCDEVWTVSQNAAETLQSYGYKGRLQIVENGTELKDPNPAQVKRAEQNFNLNDDPVLLYVGQIDWKKNLRLTLESCAELKNSGARFQLVLAGAGPDEAAVKQLAAELGLTDRLVMPGHLSDPELLAGLYAKASLFLFPSLYDTAGLVVREAAVMQTPSITIAGSAPAEVIRDGENGYVCLDSVESLSSNLKRILADPDSLARVGQNAKQTIPVGWDEVLGDVAARYECILGECAEKDRSKKRSYRLSGESAAALEKVKERKKNAKNKKKES